MKCLNCGKEGAFERRQNTEYPNDKNNYDILCDECQKERDKYWQEMWDVYNSGRI
jgi:hypothetical protein